MAKLGGRILNDVGEHLISTCVQSRLEDISRWRFDNKGWHLVPGPNDPNGEGGLPSVQLETPMMQFQVMTSKAATGWPSEEFLQGLIQGAVGEVLRKDQITSQSSTGERKQMS